MEQIKLWTRQNEKVLDILERDGVYHAKRAYIVQKNDSISDYYLTMYDWYVRNAEQRVPRPEGAEYPIWCSVSEEYMLRPIEGEVVLALSVPRERIVYLNTMHWDLALNHTYVPKDDADALRFEKLAKSRGLSNNYSFLSDNVQRFYPDLVREVKNSWLRVFDIDPDAANPFDIQANLWEIRKEDILSVAALEK